MVPVDSLDETSWDELQVLVFWGALRTSEVIRFFPEIINAPAIRSEPGRSYVRLRTRGLGTTSPRS